ncbi:MAG: DEAD/DEAH box helicase family protein, partial [Planctomycetaceae bacterium]|nr:DEAD/DEAH box helicase family protein [Planctomycetaceae bacterium]
MNLMAGSYGMHGIAIREMPTDTGPADYMLFIAGKACGIIEAKREGTNLGQVAEQSARYATSQTKHIERWMPEDQPLPFLYEATNHEIRFRDERDPKPRSRYVFHFHRPETLKDWLEQGDSFRARLQLLPELNTQGLRACQMDAIAGIENSLRQAKPRALLQMATGSGKTFTAVTEIYRLAKFTKAKRVLFLVDRGNLGRQTLKEFQQYTVPGDGRKFTELYNAHILGQAGIGDEIKVTISTIQRLYSQLTNKELDDESEEHSGYETDAGSFNQKPREVAYNPTISIEAFDVVIIDECHRSIYNLWRQVLEYFDAFLIGLTATPTKKTIGFFNQNLVSEYTHEDAVIDKVNVGYDIYSIRTKKTVAGDTIEAGTTVQIRNKLTKEKRLEELDQVEDYSGQQIDRSVIAPNQIRTIIQTFKDRVFKDIFTDRTGEWLPKTLIFAKDDDHADRIVDTVREVFGESNAFCKKVTYKVGKKTAEDTIAEFRTNPQLRVGVTVDMIATGTDIKPLEIVMFMRDVKSPGYYEQMKGRGTRVLSEDELRKVTPDARTKTRFVLVDCVGVTETDKTESKSLESKPSVSTQKLMLQIAQGDRHSDSLRSLGNRLLRLDLKLDEQQRKHVNEIITQSVPKEVVDQLSDDLLAPTTLTAIAANLIHGTKEDALVKAAQAQTGVEEVTEEQIQSAFKSKADLLMYAIHNPELRDLLETLRRDTEQIIDETADELIHDQVGYTAEKAKGLITNWQQFIEDHQDELDAIQLIYQQPYQKRHLSYEQIEKLAEAIQQPPYNLAPIEVWKAYEQLEKSKVKGVPPKELLTNIVSLIRFSTGLSDVLEPFTELVNKRFDNWLKQQDKDFKPEQLDWVNRIKDQIAQNAEMTIEDLNYIPFN